MYSTHYNILYTLQYIHFSIVYTDIYLEYLLSIDKVNKISINKATTVLLKD